MPLPNIFSKEVTDSIIQRINQIQPHSQPLWGTMSASKMMTHCCVIYEYTFEKSELRQNPIMVFVLRTFLKKLVTNEVPYKKNSQTAPQFIIKDEKDFEREKNRLIQYIQKVQELGENHFDGKYYYSFGNMTKTEWNNMFYKHLDHHLKQFGV
jgi:hypothetical protein